MSNQQLKNIYRAVALTAFAGLTLASVAGTAKAQTVPAGVTKPLAVKLGAYFPSNTDARKGGGDAQFAAEVEYTTQGLISSNSYSVLSAGVISRDNFTMYPFTIGQIFKDEGNPSKFDYYYGFGLGLYAVKLEVADTSGDMKGLFGGYGVVGLDFKKNMLVELKYHFVDRYDKKFVGGIQATVGLRF